jgi:hypothetical protein
MATRRIGTRTAGWIAIPLALLLATPGGAQAQSVEEKLREALRRVAVDLRAAQDTQAALQADLLVAQKERDALRAQVAQLSAQPAPAPAAPAAPAAPPPEMLAELERLKQVAADLTKRNTALADGLAHWQQAYQQAATIAQTKDAQARQLTATLATAQGTLGVCTAKNAKLIATAGDILHLYETPKFRATLATSWEPLLGIKRVELENIVQDHEERIRDQRYYPGEQPASAKAPGGADGAHP